MTEWSAHGDGEPVCTWVRVPQQHAKVSNHRRVVEDCPRAAQPTRRLIKHVHHPGTPQGSRGSLGYCISRGSFMILLLYLSIYISRSSVMIHPLYLSIYTYLYLSIYPSILLELGVFVGVIL